MSTPWNSALTTRRSSALNSPSTSMPASALLRPLSRPPPASLAHPSLLSPPTSLRLFASPSCWAPCISMSRCAICSFPPLPPLLLGPASPLL
eukprot:339350-Lingulodinium_polyedra.AAC.1